MSPAFERWTALVALALAGLALRFVAASGDLWLDEIWSLERARNATSQLALLTQPQHDNDHALNSAWLRLVDSDRPLVARGLALFASAVLLTGLALGGKRLRLTQCLALLAFAGFSYPLVLYGSEARGYSVAVAAITLAFVARRRSGRWGRSPGWAPAVFGPMALLGHLTSVYALAALAALDLMGALRPLSRVRPSRRDRRRALLRVVASHAPWVALLGLWVARGLLEMRIGGGARSEPVPTVVHFLSRGLGTDLLGPLGVIGAIGVLVLLGWWARAAMLPFVVTLVCALAVPLLSGHAYSQPRYFVILMAPLLYAALVALERRPRQATVLLVTLTVMQTAALSTLLHDGRGSPAAAVATVQRLSHELGGGARVYVDHRFRIGLTLDHYGEEGFSRAEAMDRSVAIALVHRLGGEAPFPEARVFSGRRFELVAQWPTDPWSGLAHAVYRDPARHH